MLDRISEIELGFPHDFLVSRNVKKEFRGHTFDQVDRVRLIALCGPGPIGSVTSRGQLRQNQQ